MPKLARMGETPAVRSPVKTTGEITTTYEGGIGHVRDAKSELFLLAASNLVGEQTFYEGSSERDVRYRGLVRQVVGEDPEWVGKLAHYLRDDLRMRAASIVMAAEYVAAGGPHGRAVVDSVLLRPDEPGELLGYWFGTYGRKIPAAIKRGIADAVGRLYTEHNALKYDGQGQPFRFGDVIELTHPKPADDYRALLYKILLDRAHKRGEPVPTRLSAMSIDDALWSVEPENRKLNLMRATEVMSWERFSSWIGRPINAAEWKALVPKMGLMAIVRNLRNMDEAGVDPETVSMVEVKLRNREDVMRSRQLPFRFYTAWREVQTLRWGSGLEAALTESLQNVPELKGRTLILVDKSGSMEDPFSRRSSVKWSEIASVFGTALALRSEEPELYAYDNREYPIPVQHGASLLRTLERFPIAGGGTQTLQVLARTWSGQDRIVIVTDEQAFPTADYGWGFNESAAKSVADIPVPIYTFNVVGYKAGHLPSGEGNRHTFGGLSDAAFTLLGILDSRRDGGWPWE